MFRAARFLNPFIFWKNQYFLTSRCQKCVIKIFCITIISKQLIHNSFNTIFNDWKFVKKWSTYIQCTFWNWDVTLFSLLNLFWTKVLPNLNVAVPKPCLIVLLPSLMDHIALHKQHIALSEKCPNTELFLVRIFLYSDWIRRCTEKTFVFSPNTGKYAPEKTPYLDAFYAVLGNVSNFRKPFIINNSL